MDNENSDFEFLGEGDDTLTSSAPPAADAARASAPEVSGGESVDGAVPHHSTHSKGGERRKLGGRPPCVNIPPDVCKSEAELKKWIDYKKPEGGTNYKYRCPQCVNERNKGVGSQLGNFKSVHLYKHAAEYKEWASLLESLYPEEYKKQMPTAESAGNKEGGSGAGTPAPKRVKSEALVLTNQTSLARFFGPAVGAQDRVRNALAVVCLEHGLPSAFVESAALHEFVDAVRNVAVAEGSAKMKADVLLCSRTTFTRVMDKVATGFVETRMAEKKKDLAESFCTFTVDSRTNINGLSITAVNAESKRIGMVPVAAVPPSAGAKDARVVADMVKKLLEENELGTYALAVCMDGAAVNVKAFALLESEIGVLTIRCQSHLMSLLLKDFFKLPSFAFLKKDLETLYSFVRHNQRVWTLFLSLTNNKVLFRPMEVRFASYVVALERVLQLRNSLTSLFDNEEYKSWVKTQRPEKRVVAREVAKIVRNAKFWGAGKFLANVSKEAVWALRILDQFNVSPGGIAAVWDSLGARFVQAINGGAEEDVDSDSSDSSEESSGDDKAKAKFTPSISMKREIVETYLRRAEEASCDLLDAAWALNPPNWREVVRMTLSEEEVDIDSWRAIKSSTEGVLRKIVDRAQSKKSVSERVETMKKLANEFSQYATRSGEFGRLAYEDEDPVAWWVASCTLLGKYAVRLVESVVVTISNTERLHKVYALVHTDTRNRLHHQRADRFARAAFWMRAARLPPKANDVHVSDFTKVAGLSATDFETYMKSLGSEAATIAAAKAGVDAAELEDTLNDAEEEEGETGDVDVAAEHVAAVGADDDDEGWDAMDAEEVASFDAPNSSSAASASSSVPVGRHYTVTAEGGVTRTRRRVRLTAVMRDALGELGLGNFFEGV
jgi:hypothetical protein